MFVPLVHPSGHGQADFGKAVAVIGGVEQRIHFLAVDLPHSDGCVARVYPVRTTEVILYRLSGPAIPGVSGQACRSIESLSMKKSRHTEEQVAFAAGLGTSAADMCRKTGVSETADQPGRPSPPRQAHGPPGRPAPRARVGLHGASVRIPASGGAAGHGR